MRDPIERLADYPAFWLGVYGCGTLMTTATIWHVFGGIAAGSTFSFLLLAAVLGYDVLTHRNSQTRLQKKIETLDKQQASLIREIARTRNDVDALKDDMVQTALTLQKELKKFNALNPLERAAEAPATVTPPPSSAMKAVQSSFQKMGQRLRPGFMPRQKPANEEVEPDLAAPSPLAAEKRESAPSPRQDTVQKYKDILMSAAPSAKRVEAEPQDEMRPSYSRTVLSELIHHAVQNDKIEIFAQPIVRLPSRKISCIELFARIRARAGVYLPADTYRPLAEEESSIENLDHLLLLHTIDTIRADARRGVMIPYFINVSAQSFKNNRYITDLLEFVRSRRDLAANLVFELQYKDYTALSPQLIRILDGISRLGCRFSLDNLTTLDIDDDRMAESGINFIKIDSGRLVELCASAKGEMDLARLKARLDQSGLELIVEKLETEQDLIELLDFEIDYGEGYLFGRPDLEMAYRKHVA